MEKFSFSFSFSSYFLLLVLCNLLLDQPLSYQWRDTVLYIILYYIILWRKSKVGKELCVITVIINAIQYTPPNPIIIPTLFQYNGYRYPLIIIIIN